MKASQIQIGRKYDFEDQDEIIQIWFEAGEGNYTGWLISKNQDNNGDWECTYKDSTNGCDIIVTVDNNYNGFIQRPANRGEDFNEIRNMMCAANDEDDEGDECGA